MPGVGVGLWDRDAGASGGAVAPVGARIYVRFDDAVASGGRHCPNRMQPERTPSDNALAFPKGRIFNESGAGTTTHFYPGKADPDGLYQAVRIVLAANGSHYFHRGSINAALNAGTKALSVFIAATPGSGPHTGVKVGHSADFSATFTVDDSWVERTHQFAYTANGDIMIRAGAAGADLVIWFPYLHNGTLASLPALADRGEMSGARMAFSFDGSMPADGDGLLDTGGLSAGGYIYDPAFPSAHAYEEMTVLMVWASTGKPSTASGYAFSADNDNTVSPATSPTTFHTGIEVAAGTAYDGGLKTAPLNIRVNAVVPMTGEGLRITGQRMKTGDLSTWLFEIPVDEAMPASLPWVVAPSWSTQSVRGFRFGSNTTTQTAERRSFQAPGLYFAVMVWDRFLSDGEMRQAVAFLRAEAAQAGLTLASPRRLLVADLDSNTEDYNGYAVKMSEAGRFANEAQLGRMIVLNTAWGGTRLDLDSVGPAWTTRFDWRLARKLQGAARCCDRVYHQMLAGTNDYPSVNSDWPDFLERLEAAWDQTEAVSGRIVELINTMIPQPDRVGSPNIEANRLLMNAEIRLRVVARGGVLVDAGGDPEVGDQSKLLTYYSTLDGEGNLIATVHLNEAGDTRLADAVLQPVLEDQDEELLAA
jgi:hypothetical protein